MWPILNNFNSIKVRLKPPGRTPPATRHRFQFHKGTIKTRSRYLSDTTYIDFNSIKVRLKLWVLNPTAVTSKFQFHKGTIKTNNKSIVIILTNIHFNSIKVRLKLFSLSLGSFQSLYFNSIKVRLKPSYTLTSLSL